MFISIVRFFDRLEDRVRARLSHRSIFYALIGGIMVIIFWRGVWHTADIIMAGDVWMKDIKGFWEIAFYEPISVVWSGAVLLMTGLFVSSFIGERIVISGLKNEKKVTDRTEEEVQNEESKIKILNSKIDVLVEEVKLIKDGLAKK
jgi:hypothetical protein